ncbi:hypothetical protein OGZ37_03880 [Lactococcus lactis]|uniref:hypothetical protein n=1 Tax=Lactococcus lactis TaxID=1358 RepID=UPI0024183AB8|nr:hypothetical protein [Lactococcus lactis]MDG4965717.1 hypothetical protein [Lactococcus lactis]
MLTKKDYEGLYELEHAFEETENKSSLRYAENRKPVIDVGAIVEVIAFLLIVVGLTCLLAFIYLIMMNQVKLSTLLNIF